ncbi:hypothetical protein PP47_gp33 [Pectobacterium phage PP47]|uniref:Uncharacterized protein n=2 Tax=Pektosvirus TaxID=2732689 RepID=A0A1L7DS08_9CAUD|nr:hypothetical protein HOR48_gp32 [Pectobacterium phage PP81]YP_009788730.1 hypothetical protein HOR52_gp33 [Pectobacterium phage PP47]APU03051.1 hypothetical protein PP81_gp32 [Pectobacterium phage PP81]APW79769.1 hypothetical protein PP47_gp33 [Pectobacterium phage PP47]
MKDLLGNSLSVGDVVVFTSYNGKGLSTGVVEKVNPKTVEVRPKSGAESYWRSTLRKNSDYVLKFEDAPKVAPLPATLAMAKVGQHDER